MKLNKEQLIILVFATGFFVVTFLYLQSLQTIKMMYEESVLTSLESTANSNVSLYWENDQKPEESLPATSTEEVVPDLIIEPIVNEPDLNCYVGGCSGQLCGDASIKDIATTCEWREEYACYKEPVTKCERQPSGNCGWTETEELNSCLMDAGETANPEVI